jgi:integrase
MTFGQVIGGSRVTFTLPSRGQGLLLLCQALRSPSPAVVRVPEGMPGKETYAYSLEEIQTMIHLLPEPARTAVSVAAFTGLDHSELRGLRWGDIIGEEIRVSRSVWHHEVGETKTKARTAPVPVIPFVTRMLAEHAKRNPGNGFVFAGPSGRPRDLATMGTKVIRPVLEGSGVEWHGWHAFRRGLATNLHRIGVPPNDSGDTPALERQHHTNVLRQDG